LKFSKNLGMLLLGAWLILNGLFQFIDIPFESMDTILAVLAIVAGILVIKK